MKFLSFAFAIAFILQDYGTFQDNTIEDCKSIEQVRLFKKYALDLIDAAIEPIRKKEDLMDGGCECVLGIGKDVKLTPFDAFFVTMSIAKDYYEDFQMIKNASDISEITGKIKPGMMENIRKILVVLQHPLKKFDKDPIHEIIRKYQLINPPAEVGGSDRSIESLMKCYRTMLSIDDGVSQEFFAKLYKGFEISGALFRDDDKILKNDARWKELRTIIDRIPLYELTIIELNCTPQEFSAFISEFNEFLEDFSQDDGSASDSK